MSYPVEKPSWKIEAERNGESLPEYFTFQEIGHITGIPTTYLVRLASKWHLPSYKVGTVRLMKNETFEAFIEKIESR